MHESNHREGPYNARLHLNIVEGLTGIFRSISDGPGTHLSRPIFDRRIDLKWFGSDQNEIVWLELQKIDFWPKIRPKIGVFPTFEAINCYVLLSKFAHLLIQI